MFQYQLLQQASYSWEYSFIFFKSTLHTVTCALLILEEAISIRRYQSVPATTILQLLGKHKTIINRTKMSLIISAFKKCVKITNIFITEQGNENQFCEICL